MNINENTEFTKVCHEQCYDIKPSNPLAVAQSIKDMYEALIAISNWMKGYGTKTQNEIFREYIEPIIAKVGSK